jgi:selenocysteine-specific elongation factor
MYVVGTSGHIDHGKTSLILALTGVDCDRLPEEKEREMTIDIGFAGMDVPGFGTVSFIDVPGHERFIRNMVAGAWGIDLGLLVVAVDDGWMPQTEDHFRVLQLLGIERIVVVLNKIDMAESGMADLVEQQVLEKIAGTPYKDSDIVRVSSKTGDGIGRLKDAIASNLKKLSQSRNADKPYLHIDRVFAPKGHGTVVTGTLRNGVLRDDDPVRIQPGGREARVKRIESHHSALAEGAPSRRTALNLSGVQADEIRRGHILYRQAFFTESGEIIALVQLLDRKRELKNNAGIEVLIGTAAVKGKIILLSSERTDPLRFPVRIKFDYPWYCYPGQPFVLANPGGFRIMGGGMVLLPGYDHRKLKAGVMESIGLLRDYTFDERVSFVISVKRWMKREAVHAFFSESDRDIDAAVSSLLKNNILKTIGDYLMIKTGYNETLRRVADNVKQHVGLNLKEISDSVGVDHDICRLIVQFLLKESIITEKEGRYFGGSDPSADPSALSKGKTKVLETALARGGDGIELDRITGDSMKVDVKELIKLGLLVSLDGNIVYHRDVYESMKNAIMSLFNKKDKLAVTDAKEAVGLSRKYLIPLLNRIERDGLIKRLGDFRVKA